MLGILGQSKVRGPGEPIAGLASCECQVVSPDPLVSAFAFAGNPQKRETVLLCGASVTWSIVTESSSPRCRCPVTIVGAFLWHTKGRVGMAYVS